MSIGEIVAGIDAEILRLKQVKALLEQDGTHRRGNGVSTGDTAKRTKHKMSAAGRARIAAAQRKRWAKLKKAAAK